MYKFLALIGLVVSILIFKIITTINYGELLPLDHSLGQIIVTPLVLVVLLVLRVAEPRIPIYLVYALFVGFLLATFYRFQYPIRLEGSGILVAQLAEDKMFNKTRIFREMINKNYVKADFAAARSLHQTFSSVTEALDFLNKNERIGRIVWGSQRWIQVVFRSHRPKELKEYGTVAKYKGLDNLSLIKSITVIGLSYEPVYATARFISDLAYEESLNVGSDSYTQAVAEIALIAAATQKSGWTSASHRAYAWWRLGNYYIDSAIRDQGFSQELLDCALNAYKHGLGDIREGDNPELRAALYNNNAVVLVLKSLYEPRARLVHTAMKQLENGYKARFEKDPFNTGGQIGDVAYNNLIIVKEAGGKKISKKLKNRSHKRKKRISKEKDNSGRKNYKRTIRKSSKRH